MVVYFPFTAEQADNKTAGFILSRLVLYGMVTLCGFCKKVRMVISKNQRSDTGVNRLNLENRLFLISIFKWLIF